MEVDEHALNPPTGLAFSAGNPVDAHLGFDQKVLCLIRGREFVFDHDGLHRAIMEADRAVLDSSSIWPEWCL